MKYTMAHNVGEARINFTNADDDTFPVASTIPQLLELFAISLDHLDAGHGRLHSPLYIYRGISSPKLEMKYYVWTDEPISLGHGRVAASIGFDAVPAGSSYPPHKTEVARPYNSALECIDIHRGHMEWKIFPVVGMWDNTGLHWDIELVK
jgi:hypothetical protein